MKAFVKFITKIVFRLFYRVNIVGINKVPKEGPAILCANHNTILDMFFLGYKLDRWIYWMAKEELFKNPIMAFVLEKLGAFPVKRGTADIESIRRSIRILMDGGKLLIFPEGTRVTEGRDVEAKAGAALLAAKTGAPLVPVYIKNARSFFKHTHVIFGNPFTVSGNRAEQNAAAKRLKDEIEAMK